MYSVVQILVIHKNNILKNCSEVSVLFHIDITKYTTQNWKA